MENTVKIFLVISLTLTHWFLNGQAGTNNELEEKRKQILEQIEIINSILEETKKNQEATLDEYMTLENQIKSRSLLIKTIQEEVDSKKASIEDNRLRIISLNEQIEKLESDYAVILRSALRQKLTRNSLLYILSSKSLKQALLRWRYTKQFEIYAKQKAELIINNLSKIDSSIHYMEQQRTSNETLLQDEQFHNKSLVNELNNKNRLLLALGKDEQKLLAQLEKQNREREQLDNVITGIVREEVSIESPATDNPAETAEAGVEYFSEQKGQLPWPVNKGFIILKFGSQKHPTLKNISITNNGIDIRSEMNSDVHAVFEGEVSGQAFIPGYDNMLVIKHGDFRTVYARLNQIFVRKGDKIKKGQPIGKLAVNENKSELHFEIWERERKLDPEAWLKSND